MVKKKSSMKQKHEEERPEEDLDKIQAAIVQLREKGKQDPSLDFNKELRKIQDRISDVKGEERRPITGKIKKKAKKKLVIVEESDDEENDEDEDDGREESDENDDDEEEDDEDEDPDAALKELINKRLTTCMLLILSFEDDNSYPEDFYKKLADSQKFEEVVSPITKDEIRILNKVLKERKKQTKKRVAKCNSKD